MDPREAAGVASMAKTNAANGQRLIRCSRCQTWGRQLPGRNALAVTATLRKLLRLHLEAAH